MTKPGTSVLLFGAILLPVLSFGVQIALAPTFPNYDPMTEAASLPGSDKSPYAVVFNTAAFLCGACGLVQRLIALAGLGPIGAAGFALWRRS